ncbi:hypothetical protein LOTGIDRAFT_159893 [Lottia gigantea]|uniref:Uncharacterized protein n=1 Tax=Lottia gigantea TaxID=225164 RepID=V4C4K6_LOTGI|nr:hypothetical protein LOTGIDRAFT_159893 [Lottia gigantea]ESO96479.1 hypothetical protein LOTGIDRAFT_159893 [Lottia gigantea]
MPTVSGKREELYGKARTFQAETMKANLTKSVVLQDGDYNMTNNQLKQGVWNTSAATDFTGQSLAEGCKSVPKTQLDHHFELAANEPVESSNYQTSLSHADFNSKDGHVRAVPCEIDRTVNWPDMAPQYIGEQNLGKSEYYNQYMNTEGSLNAPVYPKVNTSKMQLPLDPEIFHKQRNTSIVLGTDKPGKLSSEHQSSYHENYLKSRVPLSVPSNNLSSEKNSSHVFRAGDYDNICGDFKTNNMTDYGPRTRAPGEHVTFNLKQKEDPTMKLDIEENLLSKYAQENTVPRVREDAKGSRLDQENAHFQFGADERTTESLYSKDFLLAAKQPRARPQFYKTPSAGKVIQNDPVFSNFGKTTHSVDFSQKPVEEKLQWNGKTEAVNNMEKRDGNNVNFYTEDHRPTPDRQISLAHGDYKKPPPSWRPMKPQRAPPVQFDFLKANDALPYSGKGTRDTEARSTFNGTLMSGIDALQRLKSKEFNIRKGVELNRDTHFTVGVPNLTPDLTTENRARYTGHQELHQMRPAGTTEIIPEKKFSHLSISQNTQDYRPNDPYVRNTKESLRARNLYRSEIFESNQSPFETSVMRSDYVPLNTRRYTEDQLRRIDQVNTIFSEPLEKSHLFHTVPKSKSTMMTTAMTDYIKPENMNEVTQNII